MGKMHLLHCIIIILILQKIKKILMNQSVREYCKLNDSCLRDYLVKYFGFKSVQQNVCCSICTPNYKVHSEYSELDQSVKL